MTASPHPPCDPAPPVWFAALALLAVFLAQPYVGLRHDGVLYLGQLLHRLDPEPLRADIFFAHGSQDRFSIFSWGMAPLYDWLGIARAQLLLIWLGWLASFLALYRLTAGFGNPLLRWLGLACVALVSRSYGWNGTLSFAESFVTARTLAEPLALWGLLAVMHGRALWALGLIALSGLFHPLLALPALLLAGLIQAQADRRYWVAFPVLLLLVALLAGLGIGPFAALLARYDDAWWSLMREVNDVVLLQRWEWLDWQAALVDGLLLLGAVRIAPAGMQALLRATLGMGLLLLAVAALGADLGRSILLTQLQLWRGLWLVHALALCVLPCCLASLWRLGPRGQAAALAAATAVLAAYGRWHVGPALLLWALVWLLVLWREVRLSAPVVRLAQLASLGLAVGMSAMQLLTELEVWRSAYSDPLARPPWLLALTLPIVAVPLVAASLAVYGRGGRWRQTALLANGLLLGLTAAHWDWRNDWTRLIESGATAPHPFARYIAPGSQVYWHDQLAVTWVLLQRPSYYEKAQGAGLLFNRGTALDFAPRWQAWEQIRADVLSCRIFSALGQRPQAECMTPSRDTVAILCRSQPRLDFVIFERGLGLPPLASWNPQLPSQPDLKFHLYGCKQFL